MVVHDEAAAVTSTPLAAIGVLLDSEPRAALPYWDRFVGRARRLTGAMLVGHRHAVPPETARRASIGSAATAAALAQRITGSGSGPYSGTPFRPADGTADAAGRTRAVGEVSEAARHDHGIIDHSRHVSSAGRR